VGFDQERIRPVPEIFSDYRGRRRDPEPDRRADRRRWTARVAVTVTASIVTTLVALSPGYVVIPAPGPAHEKGPTLPDRPRPVVTVAPVVPR
jgi:hypothetical protein